MPKGKNYLFVLANELNIKVKKIPASNRIVIETKNGFASKQSLLSLTKSANKSNYAIRQNNVVVTQKNSKQNIFFSKELTEHFRTFTSSFGLSVFAEILFPEFNSTIF